MKALLDATRDLLACFAESSDAGDYLLAPMRGVILNHGKLSRPSAEGKWCPCTAAEGACDNPGYVTALRVPPVIAERHRSLMAAFALDCSEGATTACWMQGKHGWVCA